MNVKPTHKTLLDKKKEKEKYLSKPNEARPKGLGSETVDCAYSTMWNSL